MKRYSLLFLFSVKKHTSRLHVINYGSVRCLFILQESIIPYHLQEFSIYSCSVTLVIYFLSHNSSSGYVSNTRKIMGYKIIFCYHYQPTCRSNS